MDAQSQRLTGAISLAQPLSIKITISIIVTIIVVVMIFLLSSNYTRKETVRGYLRPDKGLFKIYTARTGTIDKILVKSGDKISKGDPLVRIVSQQSMASGLDLNQQLISEITAQLKLLTEELAQYSVLENHELIRTKQQLSTLKKEQTISLKRQLLLEEKLAILSQQQLQYNKLYQNGFLSDLELQQQQERQLNVKQDYQTLIQSLVKKQDEYDALVFELKNIPQQYQLKIRTVQQRQSEFKRQLSQTRNSYSYVIKASHSGTVAALLIHEGEHLTQNRPLLTILPQSANLIAELLLPSRSAGFVKQGNETRLRFDAFPHQRFGFLTSEIIHIDQSLITQGEVDLPIDLTEPVYRLQARLAQQHIQGYGQHFSLKSGMIFDADIQLESRSLMQWLLDPIYSLNGRLN